MRSTILTLAGILLLSANSARAEIPWNENLRAAHQQAEQQGKLLLLHFYTDNCHWCDKLEAGAFQSPQLSAAIGQHYVPVKIHAGQNPTLAQTFKVSRFPTDVIVSTDGTVLAHGVSPQAAEDYVGMLARYSGQAPAAADPMATGTAASQIAAAPPANATLGATRQNTAGPSTTTGNPTFAAAVPNGGPAPQINQFAMQAQRPAQTNPYAPQVQNQPQYRGLAGPQGQAAQGQAAQGQAAQGQTLQSTAQLSLPTGRAAAAPEVAPQATGLSMPPGMQMGVPAQTVGHRTAGMTLSQPAQLSTEDRPTASHQAPAENQLAAAPAAPQARPSAAPQQARPADQGEEPQPAANEPPPLAMQGYCPVAVLEQGKWIAGDPQNGLIHLGQLYLFSSAQAMETFRNNPEAYTPVMNGMDVVLFFEERRLVQGSREWGVTDPEFNRMFFFANEETMNHFNEHHARYTRSAIDITRQAAVEANSTTR